MPENMSASPYLSGRFAPVSRETDADDLPVEGTLPPDLNGVFMRNGPNPKFPPLGSYTYPLEGDGMIHAVWISGGRARYRNRWVETSSLRAEERAGRALFGGIMTPAFPEPGLLGPDPDPGWPIKLDAFINVIRHAGHYLALEEGTPPYEISPDLETIGRFDFGGGLPLGVCAHPRIDPRSGELVVFRYDTEPPYLTWAAIGPDGSVTQPPTEVPGITQPYMIHDFAITEHYVLFIIGPAVLDPSALLGGGDVLSWQPRLGTRIALVPRAGGPAVFAELDPFWAWHLANAYEEPAAPDTPPAPAPDGSQDGDTPGLGVFDPARVRVVADFPWWSRLTMGAGSSRGRDGEPLRGQFARVTIDPSRGTAALAEVGDVTSEFPRIDDRLTGRRHRYLTVGANSGEHDLTRGEHDRLIRYDMTSGRADSWDTDASIGEVVFAPRAGTSTAGTPTEELDGYYLTFARTLGDDRSWLYIWDAADFPQVPVARVAIPAAVPNGLHANWFPLHR
jgi:carotenoid cleavage dioxygenase-like enzyme